MLTRFTYVDTQGFYPKNAYMCTRGSPNGFR